MDFLSILVGLTVGVISSSLTWLTISFVFKPRLKFSPCISKLRTEELKSGYKYRIKLENSSRRTIIDVKLNAKLSITF